MSFDSCYFRLLPLIYQNGCSNYLYFVFRLLLIFLYILFEETVASYDMLLDMYVTYTYTFNCVNVRYTESNISQINFYLNQS